MNLDIKLESIGGMGANLIGKILGEMYVTKLGKNAVNFSSYGSEKTGSPVTAFVRWREANEDIWEITPIKHPDILILFHHSLLREKYALAGITKDTLILVNSPYSPDILAKEYNVGHTLYTIDCQNIIAEHNNTLRINMIMLGALLAVINNDTISNATKEYISELFQTKDKEIAKNNLLALNLGSQNVGKLVINGTSIPENNTEKTSYGYNNTPIGGVIPSNGSTAKNSLALSRSGYIPKYHPEKCIHCGLCDTTCPDMVFKFIEGEYKNRRTMINQGPDYNYCKGCLRCVKICPTQALTTATDTFHDFTSSHGADPVITSEAFNSENVSEGGLNE